MRRLTLPLCLALLLTPLLPLAAGEDDANDLIARAVGHTLPLHSLRGRNSMRIIDRPNDFSLGVNTDTVAHASGRLRVQASKLLGRIKAFDIGYDRLRLAFYLPRERVVYTGTAEDLRREGLTPFDPDVMLAQLLNPFAGLEDREWHRAEPPGATVTVLQESHGPRDYWRRVHYDTRQELIVGVDVIDSEGTVVYREVYKNYRPLDVEMPDGTVVRKWYPWWFKLEWPDVELSIAVDFKRIEFNPEVTAEEFQVELFDPEEVVVKPLGEAARDEAVLKSLSDD